MKHGNSRFGSAVLVLWYVQSSRSQTCASTSLDEEDRRTLSLLASRSGRGRAAHHTPSRRRGLWRDRGGIGELRVLQRDRERASILLQQFMGRGRTLRLAIKARPTPTIS
ncbi:hypothetical protein OH76DRAFT_1389352 [Lentinus brumalis]|uniref:Secreted protein n=1 Tax=Lentinus brumalis TaxID=2498619 RepID=A0A371CVT0_9APHY|nr:hypothetical protein OH76DRAFT_1389352 [Polyporus brumalis]